MPSSYPIIAELEKKGKVPEYLNKRKGMGKAQELSFWASVIERLCPSTPSRARGTVRNVPY